MKRFNLFILVFLVLVSGFNVVEAEEPLAQESINVRLKVSVMQNIKIIDPVKIDKDALSELDRGESLSIREAGKFKIESNVDWKLKVQTNINSNYDVYLRMNNSWKKVTDGGTTFTGKKEDQLINLDVKIKKNSNIQTVNINEEPIQINFTLGN